MPFATMMIALAVQAAPTDQQMQSDTALQDTSGEASSGVDDQDPLSAHPT